MAFKPALSCVRFKDATTVQGRQLTETIFKLTLIRVSVIYQILRISFNLVNFHFIQGKLRCVNSTIDSFSENEISHLTTDRIRRMGEGNIPRRGVPWPGPDRGIPTPRYLPPSQVRMAGTSRYLPPTPQPR